MSKHRPVALVTGGAKRVGRAIVERLNEAGYDIGFTYHSSGAEANRLARRLKGRAVAIEADLTDPKHASELIYRAMHDAFGRLDLLVNSASIYEPGDKLLKQMMAVHVEAPLLLCKAFEKHLRRNRGHVVNMVDLLAQRPWPEYSAYCASKAALWNLTLTLARQLAPQVTVNGIAPGVVAWPPDYPASQKRQYLRKVPLRRSGTPEDVANLVHFLATEGTYITGQVIILDGGRSLLS